MHTFLDSMLSAFQEKESHLNVVPCFPRSERSRPHLFVMARIALTDDDFWNAAPPGQLSSPISSFFSWPFAGPIHITISRCWALMSYISAKGPHSMHKEGDIASPLVFTETHDSMSASALQKWSSLLFSLLSSTASAFTTTLLFHPTLNQVSVLALQKSFSPFLPSPRFIPAPGRACKPYIMYPFRFSSKVRMLTCSVFKLTVCCFRCRSLSIILCDMWSV